MSPGKTIGLPGFEEGLGLDNLNIRFQDNRQGVPEACFTGRQTAEVHSAGIGIAQPQEDERKPDLNNKILDIHL